MFPIFFFQAEDGIRDIGVTGVQTCALPISALRAFEDLAEAGDGHRGGEPVGIDLLDGRREEDVDAERRRHRSSEERRVGKECRSRWSPYHYKKKSENLHVSNECKSLSILDR